MTQPSLVPDQHLLELIHVIRGQKVILGPDLTRLFGVSTRVLMQTVRRNEDRFPPDFAFELNRDERKNMSQFVISLKYSKSIVAFTEHGVAMTSGLLRSPRAIQVNIELIRAFVHLRHLIESNRELSRRLDELERTYDRQFAVVFQAIRGLMEPPARTRRKIGY